MFVSLPGVERNGTSVVAAGHHFRKLAPVTFSRSPLTYCAIKPVHSKQCNQLYHRARKNKAFHRTHQWNSRHHTKLSVSTADIDAFFRLLDDSVIQAFLDRDQCRKYADKYLLAMVFTYFIRANYSWKQYNRYNFFVGLYLAHDMEEDEEEFKFEILPWLYGDGWRRRYPVLLRHRDLLWGQIGYRAVVSRKCCDEVMSIRPHHPVWLRVRPEHHSGALRDYTTAYTRLGPYGPHRAPPICRLCAGADELASDDSGVAYPPDSPAGESGADEDAASPGMELSDSLLTPASGEAFCK
ncbi:speedy protein 1-B-like [Pollicipes pollicipes]|uniref:speedy protein 1-B-like n=1 Tax=Pollicipes pollicipes TaxID=41117 RepID=UPI00188560EC|nr:speedy protein 1-B-like [Pollicipes pollicipes]